MPPVVIADASPLIGLAKIGRLELLRQLYQRILIPHSVYAELQADSQRPGSLELLQALTEGWLIVADSPDIPDLDCAELKQVLDAGESEVFAEILSLEPGDRWRKAGYSTRPPRTFEFRQTAMPKTLRRGEYPVALRDLWT